MKKSVPTVKVVRDKRRNKNDNSLPLKLRITFQRKYKYYSTGISLDENEWQSLSQPDIKGNLRKIRNKIAAIENSAIIKIETISNFSFEKFEKSFFDTNYTPNLIETLYNEYIDR